MDREEAEYEARRARRLEEKRRLTAFLAEHSDSASSSDRSHRKRSKKHRKEKREKKEKKKDRKHDRKEKKSKKDRKHKKEREESKEDLEAYRRQAGLDWLSAGPSKRGMEEAREREPEKKTDEKGEALDERIEDEVRRGFRDPISKRPYGLFDPKSMNLHETAALESDKPLVSHSQPSTHPLSQKELNKLVAKAMRAKLSGDLTLHQNLCAQIENAKKASTAVVGGGKVSPNVSSKMVEEGVSVLAPVDSSGRLLHRVAEHPDAIEKSSSGVDDRRRNRGMLRDKELEAHDAEMSIAEMAKREKEEGNMDEAFVENMLKNKNKLKLPLYSKRGTDEEFTDQDQAAYESMFRSKRARMSDSKAYELDRQRAIAAHRKAQVAESKSPFEFNSPTFKQHLVVSVGKSTYLMLPTTPIAPGHCRIVPLQSIAAMNMASREVLDEVAKYKSSLERMYQEDDSQSLVYLETVLYPTKVGWHTCIECVPVEESEAELVPMYFKKALLESGDEWAGSHHKIIDTSGKPISAAIPPHFAYFHVAWGGGGFPPGGYAHSIEDTSKYKSDFGIDVLRGVKGEAGFRFGQRRETIEVQKQRADSFRKAFAPFDWTQHEHG